MTLRDRERIGKECESQVYVVNQLPPLAQLCVRAGLF